MDINIAEKLFPNITTIIVQLLATGVMLLIFKKLLWVPTQKYFAKRAEYIESTITDAKNMQDKASEFVVESEKQSRLAAVEYRNIVEQAKIDAQKAKDVIMEQASKEAKEKLDQASKEIEAKKAAAAQQMKEEIVEVAIEVATKVMNKKMDDETNKALVESFVQDVVN